MYFYVFILKYFFFWFFCHLWPEWFWVNQIKKVNFSDTKTTGNKAGENTYTDFKLMYCTNSNSSWRTQAGTGRVGGCCCRENKSEDGYSHLNFGPWLPTLIFFFFFNFLAAIGCSLELANNPSTWLKSFCWKTDIEWNDSSDQTLGKKKKKKKKYAHFFSIINSIFLFFLFFWEILIKFRRLRVF